MPEQEDLLDLDGPQIEGGYVYLARRMLNSSLWQQNHVDRIVGITCMLLANHEPREWCGIQIDRGQFVASHRRLAAVANVSRNSLRESIDRLKLVGDDGVPFMRVVEKDNYSIFTIVKFDYYQTAVNYENQGGWLKSDPPPVAQKSTTSGSDTGRGVAQKLPQTRIIVNKKSKSTRRRVAQKSATAWDGEQDPTGFDTFWSAYPRHTAEHRARIAWRRLFHGQENPELLKTILRSLAEQKRGPLRPRSQSEIYFIPYAATWLNERRWLDKPCGPAVARGAEVDDGKFEDIDNAPGLPTEESMDPGAEPGGDLPDDGPEDRPDEDERGADGLGHQLPHLHDLAGGLLNRPAPDANVREG